MSDKDENTVDQEVKKEEVEGETTAEGEESEKKTEETAENGETKEDEVKEETGTDEAEGETKAEDEAEGETKTEDESPAKEGEGEQVEQEAAAEEQEKAEEDAQKEEEPPAEEQQTTEEQQAAADEPPAEEEPPAEKELEPPAQEEETAEEPPAEEAEGTQEDVPAEEVTQAEEAAPADEGAPVDEEKKEEEEGQEELVNGEEIDRDVAMEDLPPEQKEECERLFNEFETDGRIPFTAFKRLLRRLDQNPTDDEAMEWFNEADKNNNDSIDFSEFVGAYQKHRMDKDAQREQMMECLAKVFGKECDHIDIKHVQSLIAGMEKQRSTLTDDDIHRFCDEIDTNHNGKIERSELADRLCGIKGN
ncbi:neurofilament medium polypeptide-like [Gigantopelta aegis]|uniref:neurofilament medium polypeptide-like n=1 Tax=Gigantopelta aegis TaxID=1735272 RepID=UPI001B88E57C|nr:neurofilament medium polypeptide-like [Gigantopelta aegis]